MDSKADREGAEEGAILYLEASSAPLCANWLDCIPRSTSEASKTSRGCARLSRSSLEKQITAIHLVVQP